MQSKKMWQTLLVITFFLIGAAISAYISASFRNVKWQIFFGVGAALLFVALLPLLLKEKCPKISLLSLFLDAAACGLLVGSYFVGSGTPLSFTVVFFSAVGSAGTYLVFMLLLTVPVLREKRVYIILATLFWCVALFTAGGILWHRRGGENYAAFTLFSVATIFLAVGSLFHSGDFEELLFALVIPASLAAGLIALIVLLALVCGDGDCDCDCCDGSDCCDCTPDYGSKKAKKTTMSQLSDPLP